MRVSVIMPAYNRAALLPAALGSLLRQRHEAELDIIVVDDGSTDGTEAVLQDFARRYGEVRYTRQEHAGVARARNHGRSLLPDAADLVTFLDSDDVAVAGRFALEMPWFEGDPQLALTYSQITLTDAIDDLLFRPAAGAKTCTVRGVSLSTALFRKSALDALGPFDERLEQHEDQDLLYRFFESGQKFQMLDHVSVLYRRHAGNTTRDHQEAMRNLLRVLALAIQRRRADPSLGALPRFFDVATLFEAENAWTR